MRIANLVIVTAILIVLPNVEALAQWRVAPTVSVGYQFIDNATLSPIPEFEESIQGAAAEAEVALRYNSPVIAFELTPRINLETFDKSDFDATNSFVDLLWARTGQRYRLGLRGSYNDEVIRNGELGNVDFDIEDPGEIPVDDAGTTFSNNNRTRIQLEPQWTFEISQRMSVDLSYRYLEIDYDDSTALNDFDQSMFTGEFAVKVSERDSLGIAAYSRKNNFSNSPSVSGDGIGATYNRAISENSNFEVLLGVDNTKDDSGQKQSNPVGRVSYTRRYERGRLLASYRQIVNGNGSGTVSLRDQIDLTAFRDLSERTSLRLGLRWSSTGALQDESGTFNGRDSLQIRGELAWQATQTLTIDFNYRYNVIERDSFDSQATSNLIGIWLRYKPIVR